MSWAWSRSNEQKYNKIDILIELNEGRNRTKNIIFLDFTEITNILTFLADRYGLNNPPLRN